MASRKTAAISAARKALPANRHSTDLLVQSAVALDEINRRKLYTDLGYQSFDTFTREELGITAKTAKRRIRCGIFLLETDPSNTAPALTLRQIEAERRRKA